jgi:hypothetical protein
VNWTQKITIIFISCFLLSCGIQLSSLAQNTELTDKEEELFEQAEENMDNENYQKALRLYSQLLSLYTDDVVFRYKYAACLIQLNQDIEKAIEYLNIAKNHAKSEVPQIHYYLGQAFHQRYMFDKAIRHYSKFNPDDIRWRDRDKFPVHRQIMMANNGKKLIRYAYMLDVVDKKNLNRSNFYYAYDMDGIGGEFVKKHTSLQTRYDSKHEESPIVFISHANDKLMFSSYGKRGNTGKDIYFADRQSDGTWGEPYKLEHPINTNEDDAYPFLHPDGKHLYFSSKGHNSMGGYDLFVSRYNETLKCWEVPENLDFPINSPRDDFLYIADSLMDYAVFASNRDAEGDRLLVYTIRIKKDPEEREIENIHDIRKISRLELSPLADQMRLRDDTTEHIEEGQYTKEQDAKPKDEDHLSDKKMADYSELREKLESDISTLARLKKQGDNKLNKFKHSVIDAQESGNTKFMLDAAEIHHMFRQQISNLKSDIEELQPIYREIPEQPRENAVDTLMNMLESIHASNQRIIEQYKSIDILADLEKKLDTKKTKLEFNRKALAQIEQEMEQNLKKARDQGRSNDESLEKRQDELRNRYIQLACETSLDSLKMRDIKNRIKHAKTIFADLASKPSKPISLPERQISEVSSDFKKERITKLSEKQRHIKQETNKKYALVPWYEDEDFRGYIEENLSQAETRNDQISDIEISKYPELAQNVNKQNRLYNEAKQIQKQVNEETDENRKREMYQKLDEKAGKLERINQKLAGYIENPDLYTAQKADEQQDRDVSDQTETDHVETEAADSKISEVYDTAEINASAEKIRNDLSQPLTEVPETAEGKIKNYKNNIEDKKQRVVNVHQGYYIQLKAAFNELKNKHEISEQRNEIFRAENLMEEAESFKIDADNQDSVDRKLVLYEKAEKKALEANQLLNETYKEKTGKKPADFSPPDLPSASEFKAYEDKQTEMLTEVEHPDGKRRSMGEGYSAKIREQILNKTDSLARAEQAIDTRLKSTPNRGEKMHLARERDIINFKMHESLNKLIHSESEAMETRIENNNKKLQTLAEAGKIKDKKIPNTKTSGFTPPVEQDISLSLRKQQMAVATDLFEKKIKILEKQERILNSVRSTSREQLPAQWYDIYSKLINLDYNRPPDPELTAALSAWDLPDADNLDYSTKQKKNLVEIRSEKVELKEKIENTKQEIEKVKKTSWSDSKIQKKVKKLQQTLSTEQLKLQQNSYNEQKQLVDVQKELIKTPNTPIEKIADQIADSLETVAKRTQRLVSAEDDLTNKEKTDNLAYATGLLKEANNIRYMRTESDESSNRMLEKLVMHYRPEKPGWLADADATADKETEHMTGENETDSPESERGNISNGESTDRQDDFSYEDDQKKEQDSQIIAEEKNDKDKDQETLVPEANISEDDFFYRIQIAALGQPLQGSRYKGLSPVVNEQVENRPLYRYLCGKFYNMRSWRQPLSLIKSIGFNDAFVVGYLEGRRLTLSQAPQYKHLERDLPPEFNYYGDKDILAEDIDQEQDQDTPVYQPNENIMASNLNEIGESFLTVQIGVYSKALDQSSIRGINIDYYNRTDKRFYRYFHGKFETRAEADARCSEIKNSIKDAFVTLHTGEQPYRQNAVRSETAEQVAAGLDIPVESEQIEVSPADTADKTPEIRIQIGAYVGKMNNDVLRRYMDAFEPYRIVVMRQGRYHYYQLTGFDNYAVAKSVLRRMVIPEIPDAFLTAYRGNIKIPVRRAMLIMKND